MSKNTQTLGDAINQWNEQMEAPKLNQKVVDQLAGSCYVLTGHVNTDHFAYWKFAELLMQKCRGVLDEVYEQTPLEHVGPLLTLEKRILETFYSD